MSMLSRAPNELARRGTWTCLTCASFGSTFPARTTVHQQLSGQRHGRKNSSSKASSSPKEISKSIAAPADPTNKPVPQDSTAASSDVPAASERRTEALRSSKRKLKENVRDTGVKTDFATQMNLPSVPSTQNLHPLNVHLASFFSTHRPLSITKAIPPPTSIAAFSSVFEAKPPSNSAQSDVIYTLASAVEHLEGSPSDQQQNEVPEEIDLQTAVTQASFSNGFNAQNPHNLDLPAKTFHINLQDLSEKLRPYTPPPPPVPFGALQEAAGKNSKADHPPRHTERKSYRTTLTIYESTHPNGQRSYETHSSPFVIDSSPSENGKHLPSAQSRSQPFLARMRERRVKYEERIDERLGNEMWQLISVKRQRKLKMKKHKYKKLMKRTKNLRRRLDRI